jgi:hypothetical protein
MKKLMWQYDYKKTLQDFQHDLSGVLNEIKAMARMEEMS